MNNPLSLVLKLICICLIKVMRFTVNAFFFLLPVGLHILILQFAKKMSPMSSLVAYVNQEKSEWMFIYPNTIMISIEPNLYKNTLKKLNKNLDNFLIKNNNVIKFIMSLLVIICLVLVVVALWG